MSQAKYQKIYQYLLDQIHSKSICPGDKLPNENDLAEIFQVHRMTVRQATDKLVNDNMVVRKRGKGTFLLAESPPMLTRSLEGISTYYDDVVKAGLVPRYKTLEAQIVTADLQVAANLGLSANEQVVYIKRLMLASSVPLVVERCYLPASLFASILKLELNTMLYQILREEYGYNLTKSRQELMAVLPSEAERKLLKISSNCPCISVEGVVYSDTGIPIEFTRSLYRGDKYRFKCSIGSYVYNGS